MKITLPGSETTVMDAVDILNGLLAKEKALTDAGVDAVERMLWRYRDVITAERVPEVGAWLARYREARQQ